MTLICSQRDFLNFIPRFNVQTVPNTKGLKQITPNGSLAEIFVLISGHTRLRFHPHIERTQG